LSIAQSVFGIREITDKQTIATGKPENFDQVRRNLFNQVRKLEAGQGNIIGNVASISGKAASKTISEEIEKAFLDGLPEGFTGQTNIVFPEPKPEVPIADPFIWSVRKTDEGITASGNAVSEEERQTLIEDLKKSFNVSEVEDIQTIAAGKPENFDSVRTLLIQQLKLLKSGEAVISGNEVNMEGSIRNNNLLSLVERALASKMPEGYNVRLNITAPETTVIKGTDIEFKPRVDEETCQRLIVEAIAGRKILFETNRAIIQPNSQSILDDIIKAAQECPDVRIEIGGHTDDRGRDEFNLELSEARADAVLEYMANNGVEGSRLEAKGYGETSPVASNDTAQNRTLTLALNFDMQWTDYLSLIGIIMRISCISVLSCVSLAFPLILRWFRFPFSLF
ncbi:MAG: OmpA family protein, partial [Pseudomonadota bacterium]